ncbi:MAG: hypothetical protein ACTSYM_08695 [Candidatus Baldrarchaeia archaeon]
MHHPFQSIKAISNGVPSSRVIDATAMPELPDRSKATTEITIKTMISIPQVEIAGNLESICLYLSIPILRIRSFLVAIPAVSDIN